MAKRQRKAQIPQPETAGEKLRKKLNRQKPTKAQRVGGNTQLTRDKKGRFTARSKK